ncbi:MAG: PhoX family protein [Hyphomonadaceae bacterium]|nr:PhoX family protein [Hyphomonadaceae bacterium]
MIHRRHFLRSATALAVAMPAFSALGACTSMSATDTPVPTDLVPDPDGWLDLPEGFSYQRFSLTGETMNDGFAVPADHDGMAAFAVEGDPDRCVLVRNHEVNAEDHEQGPFAADPALASRIEAGQFYDMDDAGRLLGGGTTSLLYNLRTGELERSWLSLAGTERNCSGGPTPWGSWLSCEESRRSAGDGTARDHGYVFEVPSSARGPVPARPLTALGRFNHEAIAIDPSTGIVYQTEDDAAGLFYRFLPNQPGDLAQGGRLQALALVDREITDTRNWAAGQQIAQGEALAVRWIDLEDVTAPNGDLAERGHAKGAALFARGEGMAWAQEGGSGAICFACTSGGPAECGQIWRYVPSPYEGTAGEASAPGQLVLQFESPNQSTLDMCDNIVAAPWGHLVICEDGRDDQYVRGLTPDGRIYPIARNAHPENSEFAGACFSPDGTVLFVNVQDPGATYAIRGPWERLAV